MAGGVPTVEKLGAMTPEQLEAIAGIGAEVERIQQAVLSYYGQFENSMEEQNSPEALAEISEGGPVAAEEPPDGSLPAEELEKQSVTIESGEPSRSGGV
jgi:hypothetical protein